MEMQEAALTNRIAEILKEKNITAYALAKKLGRNPNVITRLITGERGASDVLKKQVSDALGRPVHEVFLFD